MRKKKVSVGRLCRRLAALLFCAFFVCSPAFVTRVGVPTLAASSAYWDSQIDMIKAQQEEAKKELAGVSEKLNSANAQLLGMEQIRDLQQQEILLIEKEMAYLEQLIMTYSLEIEEKEAAIQQIKVTMAANFENFKKRLVFMHEAGQEGYLDFMFNSESFADFLSRGEITSDFLQYDKDLIESLQRDYENLMIMQEEVKLLLAEAAKTYEEFEEQTLVLQAKVEVYNQKIADYETALQAIRNEYQAAKDREDRLNADLAYAEDQYDTAYKHEQAANSGGTGNKNPGQWGSKYTGKRFPCPLPAGTYTKSQPYGYGHGGVDLATFNGWNAMVPIYAAESGTVVASYNHPSWGEHVKISHGDLDVGKDVYTLYAHLKLGTRTVKAGDYVNKGDILGYVGSTGNSTGPHLHFELYIGGSSTSCRCNPEAY